MCIRDRVGSSTFQDTSWGLELGTHHAVAHIKVLLELQAIQRRLVRGRYFRTPRFFLSVKPEVATLVGSSTFQDMSWGLELGTHHAVAHIKVLLELQAIQRRSVRGAHSRTSQPASIFHDLTKGSIN